MLLPLIALTLTGCNKEVKQVDADRFEQIIAREGVTLIDVRSAEEYAEGHIPGARNIDVRQAGFADSVEAQGEVALYCLRGRRSLTAAAMLTGRGLTLYSLEGGIEAWRQAGKPVE